MKAISEITLTDFKEAMVSVMDKGHCSIAPLGISGDTLKIHHLDKDGISRCQQVSIRLYCGGPELLITDDAGSFLFYGRYDIRIGLEAVAEEYFRIFSLIKNLIPETLNEATQLKIVDNPHYTSGWKMIGINK